jgi:outer membrane murein-binding lipoprotein Lpp
MRRTALSTTMALVLGLTLLGCKSKEAAQKEEPNAPEKTGLAGEFDRTINDRDVMREAVDAANQVVQNAADCDAARAAMPAAQAKLAEAAKQVKTPAGRASIESLQRSIDRVADACP